MINTERLQLVPLTTDQLTQWAFHPEALEADLKCRYKATPVEGPFLEIIKGQIKSIKKDPGHFKFYTFWFMIRKTDRVVVGTLVLKGPPDENGALEIGYGLGTAYEKQGYMTEAVRAVSCWALEKEHVTHILAETDASNQASHKVLKGCGFKLHKEGHTFWWIR